MIRFLFISLLALTFYSCKKKNPLEQTIIGTVTNLNSGKVVEGAKLTIKARVVESGVVHTNFSDLASTYSTADGGYELSFDKINASEYRIEVSHPNYFSSTITVSADAVNGANPYTKNISIGSQSTVAVRLFNEEPVDSTERFSYGYNGPELPCNCCTKGAITLIGPADTTITCNVYGDRYYTYSYTLMTTGKPIKQVVDSAFCITGKTTQILINY